MDIGVDKTSPINKNELKDIDIGDEDAFGRSINNYTIDDDDDDDENKNNNNYRSSKKNNNRSSNRTSNTAAGRYPSYSTGGIPLDTADVGSSLPSVDEIRTSAAINNSSGRNVKTTSGDTSDNNNGGGSVVVDPKDNDVENMDDYNDFTSTPAAAETTAARNKRRFKYIVFASIFIFLIALIIGVILSIRSRRNGNNGNGSNDGSNEPRKVDVTTLRDYLLKNYKIQFDIPSSSTDGASKSSHQYQAAVWMANVDKANMKLPKSLPIVDSIDDSVYAYRFLSRYVLALIYYSTGGGGGSMNTNDSNGGTGTVTNPDYWISPLGFLSGSDICSWTGTVFTIYRLYSVGITCYNLEPNTNMIDNVTSAEELMIPSSLRLPYNNLTGTIPTEIGLLTSLQVIDLKYNNYISGTIPTEICNLKQLKFLFVGYNNINGQIPDCINQLQNLEKLFTSNNIMTGTLPTTMKLLTKLNMAMMDDNLHFGNPTTIFDSMTQLSQLMLHSNSFTGAINSQWLKDHHNLTILDLSDNNFTVAQGSTFALPRELTRLSKLRILDMSENKLTGSLPEEQFESLNSVLNILHLHGNKITGSIPVSIGNCTNLTHFDISDNELTGMIPSTIYTLSNLTTLFLSNNPKMTASSIPTELSTLPNLKELSLRNTNRNGQLLHHFGDLLGLIVLDVSSNPLLNGTIPDKFGNLSKLEFLFLNNNPGMTGTIPTTFDKLSSLRTIYLDGTGFTGTGEPICKLDRFQVANTVEFGDYVHATCSNETGNDQFGLNCTCCLCCNSTFGTKSCSNPLVGNFHAEWEFDFTRTYYEFVPENVYIASYRIDP